MKFRIQTIFLLFLIVSTLKSETVNNWISYSLSTINQYGVYHFRKNYFIPEIPKTLFLKISADNKYILYINGKLISSGPNKGDLITYKYDLVDVAPFLVKGNNVFAAKVYNAGEDKPLAFVGLQTAFFIQSFDSEYQITTDKTWKAYRNKAYRPIGYKQLLQPAWFYGFYASGCGDDISMKRYPDGWENQEFNDKEWKNAVELDAKTCQKWNLVPSNLPKLDKTTVFPVKIRESLNAVVFGKLSEDNFKISIPAHTKSTILFDFENMTYGHPQLLVNNGRGSIIKIKYAESLYDSINAKAHRDSVIGKKMFGVWDVFRPEGIPKALFRPLSTRSFRYVMLEITTNTKPLEILQFSNESEGYPYPNTSTFVCDNQQLNTIFNMSLRTFKLCSSDTYYDTPYYEQLNYGGDNVPIGAISFYNSTDDRLYKEMLRLYPQSVNTQTGLFKSAYPSRFDFDMGTWSLAWIQSLNDYYCMRGDSVFVKPFVGNIEKNIELFSTSLKREFDASGTFKSEKFCGLECKNRECSS